MLKPSSRQPLRAVLAMALALGCSVGPVQAMPLGDTVSRFLADNALVESAVAAAQTAQSAGNAVLDTVRDSASELVINSMNFLGVPYKRGGNTAETGFDCSGFTRHVFESSIGLLLPRRSAEQANAPGLLKVSKEQLKPGDLVFFNTMRRAFSHVGIYIGDGKFVHAPRTGSEIKVEDLGASYWTKRFNGARRVPELEAQAAAANAGESGAQALSARLAVQALPAAAAPADVSAR